MSKDIQLYQVSENDLEKCLKCSICNAYCPVSGVTLKFPGPKWEGTEKLKPTIKLKVDDGEIAVLPFIICLF